MVQSGMSEGSKGVGATVITVIAVLAGLAAIIGLWPTFGSYFIANGQADREDGATNSIASESSTPTAPVPSPEPTATPLEPAPVPVPVQATTMQEIIVGTVIATPAVPCCMVGPGLYELGDDGETSVGYTWSSRMSDGTENDSKTCAMLVTVTGPENPPALRRMDCSVHRSNGFSNYGNIAYLTTPGEYTITVTDEVSGVVGVGYFTVIN